MVLFRTVVEIFHLWMMRVVPCSALSLLIAAAWASLPSMVLCSGTPCRWMACVRNRSAASVSRCSVCRNAMVWPCVSTAQEIAPRALALDVRRVLTPTTHPAACGGGRPPPVAASLAPPSAGGSRGRSAPRVLPSMLRHAESFRERPRTSARPCACSPVEHAPPESCSPWSLSSVRRG